MNLVGKLLSRRYDIIEKIGEGGMATVYKARCKLLNRNVAVKILKDEFAKDSQFVKRFRAEAQSAASLTHPNIVSVYDVGEEDGINYIVMECLEGKTLKDYINENGKLNNETTLKYASQIASALEAAHKAKIIHRDIKPQNIVFSNNKNVVKVTDFGIAKMTTTNTITSQNNTIGSVHYFSPEHAKGCYIDEKSDIYSLGIVMYEMATGKLPFNADTAVSVALKQIQEEPIEPKKIISTVSDDLNRIIMKAMQKSSVNRYNSASEMLDDIFAAINNPGHVFKTEPKIVAGGTQIIPVIGLKNTDNLSIGDIEEEPNNLYQQIEKESIEEKQKDKKDAMKGIEQANENIENKEKSKNKRKKIIITISIIAAISAITLTILSIKLISTLNSKNKKNQIQIETVPYVVGENYEQIKEQYNNLGYTIELDKYEFSLDYEEGIIISQSLVAGDAINTKTMSVIVSKGKKTVKMPDVTGKDYTVVKYELESLGLKPEFEFEEDDKIEKNIIKTQKTDANEEIPVESTVVLIVSKGNGKEIVLMPCVIGYTEDAAKKALQKLKFNVDVVYVEDNAKSNGVVVIQSKKENEELEQGTLVTISVNRIQKTKNVDIDISEYITDEEIDSINLKVIAKVEGVQNTICNKIVYKPFDPVTVEVNGFTNAILYIYVNTTQVSELEVIF